MSAPVKLPTREELHTPAVEFVSALLKRAETAGASDIYVEPAGAGYRIRLRIDGFFSDLPLPDHVPPREVVARIKVLSRLMGYVSREPQEGRIPGDSGDMRVSVLPTVRGERVVIRLFGKHGRNSELSELMGGSPVYNPYISLLDRSAGVIFVAGPSGSGKTTTLYASMRYLQKHRGDHCSLVSVEDPVETVLDGIQQTEVGLGSGVDFSDVLPYLLRQDPEVIMVGETRDPRTASMVMQAGLTGHLVLSTIHTEDAAGVMPRLRQMGMPKYMDCAVTGILSQRLVRGLNGRTAFFELLLRKNANELSKINTLSEDGLRLLKEGETNAAELIRVLGTDRLKEADLENIS